MQADLHILINHLPLDLAVVGFFLALHGLVRNNEDTIRLGLVILIAGAAIAALTFRTGPLTAEHLNYSMETASGAFSEHRRLGYLGQATLLFAGVLAAIALFLYRTDEQIQRLYLGFLLTFCLVAILFAGRAFLSGKRLAHGELFGHRSQCDEPIDLGQSGPGYVVCNGQHSGSETRWSLTVRGLVIN